MTMPRDLPLFWEIACPACGNIIVRFSIPREDDPYPFGWIIEETEGCRFELDAPDDEEEEE